MLRGIRNASSNWLGKSVMVVIMGVLIVSFAVWGIADIFRGFGRSTLASVGSTEIGIEQFRQVYNDRLREFGRQLGRPLTMEQARALGLDRQILRQSIAEAVLDESVRRRGLGLSDEGLRTAIMNDPVFRGVNGSFDPARFALLLQRAGYSEQRFIAEQRQQTLRRQIAATVNGGLVPPKAMVDAFVAFQSEERDAQYFRLGEAQAGAIAAPTDEQLRAFFEDRKASFRAPEYRKIAIVDVTPEKLAKTIEISDEDARKTFEQEKARFSQPEKRHLLQLVFENEAAAKSAAAKIKTGASFTDLAAEQGKKAEDIDLGTIAKSDIIDPAVADAAFALGEGAVSEPVKGRFGWVLLKADKIEPGVTPTFESVTADIKSDLATARARGRVSEIYNKIEDERAGGANVAEAARKLGLDVTTIEAVDRSGRGPDDRQVSGIPENTNILTQAFASDLGIESEPVQSQGGYIWYDVLGITPSRERTFDEVRGKVAERWRADEIAGRLRKRAEEMVKELDAGKTLAEVAATAGVTVETATGLKRQAQAQALGQGVVADIFGTAEGRAGQTAGKDETERVVFRVTRVAVPSQAGEEAARRASEALKTPLADELVAQYVVALESDIGVRINESAVQQVVGGGGGAAN